MPRMPHNNRVSTSHALKTSDIWSRTIGHDPYSNQSEAGGAEESNAEKARGLLELARHQNLTGGRSGGGDAGGDDFARKMFLGLKGGKKRASDNTNQNTGNLDADARALLQEESSSSEEEFVQPTTDAAALGNLKDDKGEDSDSSS